MTTSKHKNFSASEKLESSQEHAQKALNTTTTAAQTIADHACSVAETAYQESKTELLAAAKDVGDAACKSYSILAEQTAAASLNYREKLASFEKELSHSVQENPLQSIGIAFGIGVVLGILLNKK